MRLTWSGHSAVIEGETTIVDFAVIEARKLGFTDADHELLFAGISLLLATNIRPPLRSHVAVVRGRTLAIGFALDDPGTHFEGFLTPEAHIGY